MNKYKRALELISKKINDDYLDNEFQTLDELVDKTIPKKLDSLYYKIHKEYDEYYVKGYCLVCGYEFNISKKNKPNYCPKCGQRIMWEE